MTRSIPTLRLSVLALAVAASGCMMPVTRPAPGTGGGNAGGGNAGGGNAGGGTAGDALLLTACRAQVEAKMRREVGMQRMRHTEGRVIRANAREWLAGGEGTATTTDGANQRYTYVCSVDPQNGYRITSAGYSRK